MLVVTAVELIRGGKTLAHPSMLFSILGMSTPRPTLLQAAKAFIAKSAKAAVVIAPLAVAAVPTNAEAQITFGAIDSASGEIVPPSGGGSPSNFVVSDWFTQSLSPRDGFEGQRFGGTHTITGVQGYEFEAVFRFESSAGSSGTLAVKNEWIPFTYQFSLSASEGITNASWSVEIFANGTLSGESYPYDTDINGAPYNEAFGFGTETFHSTIDLLTGTELSDGPPTFDLSGYYLEFILKFNASSSDDWITLTMDRSAGDGFALGSNTLTAVPEPSTYALLFGLTAVGYAVYRRRRTD